MWRRHCVFVYGQIKKSKCCYCAIQDWKPVKLKKVFIIKGIVSDSNNIFLWHESEDINEKSLFPEFQLIPVSSFQVMHDYVCFIAPIDYCVE